MDGACSTNGGGCWWESQREGGHWEDQDVGGWIFLQIRWGGVNWIGPARDRDWWRALANAVMIHEMPGNSAPPACSLCRYVSPGSRYTKLLSQPNVGLYNHLRGIGICHGDLHSLSPKVSFGLRTNEGEEDDEMGGACSTSGGEEGRRPLGRPRRSWLGGSFRDRLGRCGLAQDRDSSCECGTEPSGSIKCWETLQCPNN
jgi:hypothetical protein